MVYNFLGVKKAASGAYYYDERDVDMIKIPIAKCEGYTLSPQELKHYFGLDESRMRALPKYLIAPHLNSTWNAGRSNSTGRSWWDITGEMVVYRPIEWVPTVKESRTIPASHFELEFNRTTTTIETSMLYGKTELSFSLSGGASYKGVKAEVSATASIEASYKTSTERKEELSEKGKMGDVVVKEIILGLSIRVERVYERNVRLYLNNDKKSDSLTWDGPDSWDSLHVPASALRDVDALQYSNIRMTGSGHSDSLYVQALPVFDDNKELTDVHLVLSCKGWTDWYAYPGQGQKVTDGRVERLPVPDNERPLVTFLAVKPDGEKVV